MAVLESKTLGDMLDELAERYQDRVAVVFEDTRFTYRELKARADALARSLLAVGVGKGSRVGLLISNRPEWLFWDFAVAKVGGIMVSLNTWYKDQEMAYVLRHSDLSTLVMMDRFLKNDYLTMMERICPEIRDASFGKIFSERFPFLRNLICLGGRVPKAGLTEAAFVEIGQHVPEAVLKNAQAEVRPDDIVYCIYTSGTTSFPKGVLQRHHSVVRNGFNIGEYQALDESDRSCLPYPFFFSAGSCNVSMATLSHGACLYLQEKFEPEDMLRLFEEEMITVYHGMANMTLRILDHPEAKKRDTRSLDKGEGGPMKRLMDELGPTRIVNMYGLTETCTAATCGDAREPVEVRLSNNGRPFPGVEVKIADPVTKKSLAQGEKGEICIKGYNVTPGYYKEPELTANSFDEEGFFHTGDQGWMDAEGYLHYEGRLKEIIKTGGINVSPAEVESAIIAHPKVAEAHVVGIPKEAGDEDVMAFVVLHEGEDMSEQELQEYCRERMAKFKVPKMVEFRKAHQLPRTGSDKVQKVKLIEEVLQRVKQQAQESPRQ